MVTPPSLTPNMSSVSWPADTSHFGDRRTRHPDHSAPGPTRRVGHHRDRPGHRRRLIGRSRWRIRKLPSPALCGASPVQASSGPIVRHRLNRGGDRQANNALWRISDALRPPPSNTEKRRAEGKTRREIIRSETPHRPPGLRLLTDPPSTPDGADLRCLRQKTRTTLALPTQRVSATGTRPLRYHQWLTTPNPI